MTLREALHGARERRVALGHFNVAEFATLKAVFEAARSLNVPVIIGVSESERDFLGVWQIVAFIKSLRDEYSFPIFLNADHTHSVERAREAIDAGFDAVLFDGGKLPLEENIKSTKDVVDYARIVSEREKREIVIEGELGYIGASSEVFDELPQGAMIREKDLTTAEDAERFVKETGVHLLAPAVGNVHGMFRNAPNPRLYIVRIEEIREATNIPLVLHGGSGTSDQDFRDAIAAGVSIVHISTELRVAWREGVARGLTRNVNEVAPYKILPEAVSAVERVVLQRLKLFNRIL